MSPLVPSHGNRYIGESEKNIRKVFETVGTQWGLDTGEGVVAQDGLFR